MCAPPHAGLDLASTPLGAGRWRAASSSHRSGLSLISTLASALDVHALAKLDLAKLELKRSLAARLFPLLAQYFEHTRRQWSALPGVVLAEVDLQPFKQLLLRTSKVLDALGDGTDLIPREEGGKPARAAGNSKKASVAGGTCSVLAVDV